MDYQLAALVAEGPRRPTLKDCVTLQMLCFVGQNIATRRQEAATLAMVIAWGYRYHKGSSRRRGTKSMPTDAGTNYMTSTMKFIAVFAATALAATVALASEWTVPQSAFLERHCFECHADSTKEGGLDLGGLSRDLADA